ncbi:putative transport protein HsrA [Streptomyces sp. ADI96-02]|uniref:MFS transporter n=1 Tax=Streptomyces sp. ADI96-02 TaxID=1522760 RepID=UPI000F55188E|nr:MFS transporter [Streptomyces sp. ADI96-02]RPK68827.1 putative transport protein HsrA [Streptomyces sp. ADI96-02]
MRRIGDGDVRSFSRRDRTVLIAAAMAALVVQLNWLSVNTALPEIAGDLNRSPTDLHWLVTAFMLGFGGAMSVTGWVTQAVGVRRTTAYGFFFFLLSSLVCAAASSLPWLIVGRALQGVVGAFVLPGAVAMTAGAFRGRQRDIAVGFVLAASGAGAASAPFVGGLLAEAFGWRAVFLANVPVALIAIVFVRWRLPAPTGPKGAGRRTPLVTGACITLSSIGLAVTADRGTAWGWSSTSTLTCLSLSLGLLAVYVILERDSSGGVRKRTLYRDRPLHVLTIAGSTSVVGLVIVSTFSMLHLQDGLGLSVLVAGCAFLGFSIPHTLAAYAAGHLGRVRNAHALLTLTLALTAAGVATLTAEAFPGVYVTALAVCGAGFGLTSGLTNVLVQHRVTPDQAGVVSRQSLAIQYLAAAVATSFASTSLESLHHRVAGAATDTGAIDVIRRAAALLLIVGALVTLPTTVRTLRHQQSEPQRD